MYLSVQFGFKTGLNLQYWQYAHFEYHNLIVILVHINYVKYIEMASLKCAKNIKAKRHYKGIFIR